MGVHGLWRLLESTGRPINPETLEGKILAVDISIWLNQAVKGVRDREGNSVHNAHLLTLFHRICKLLFFRIRPVFVFDGDAPLLKKQTLALRRQRKEELSRESRQTNEKLLKTFLKRQAIKAALGDRSKDPLPSISSVRRDEVDDLYVLPALPPAEDNDKNSSEEEEEKALEEMADSYNMYQGDLYEDPNSVDINSEEFASLPAEMKHEILKDMKEFTKRRRTMYHKPPEHSGDFSQYQLAGLLQRNKLNQRLEGVEREMSERSAGSAPQIHKEDGDQKNHSVESHRLVSEDHAHYILIKGSTKSERAPESQPVAPPWSGGPLSGSRRRGADRPEPLWRPVCEEEEEDGPSSSAEPKPSASKPTISSQGDTLPPSPRTLKAIQAAMGDSSDEEKEDQEKRAGSVSPRTLLAIQQALAEEDDGVAESRTHIDNSPTDLKAYRQHPAPQVVISSSEEEREADDDPSLINSQASGSLSGQDVHVRDHLLDSSSEDEIVEVIAQRNKALRNSAALEHPNRRSEREPQSVREALKSQEQIKEGDLTEREIGRRCRAEEVGEVERREVGHGWIAESLDHDQEEHSGQSQGAAAHQRLSNINLSAHIQREPLNAEQRSEETIKIQDRTNGDVKTEDSDQSDSEESFIEVSNGEEEEGHAEDLPRDMSGIVSPGEVNEVRNKTEEKQEESLTSTSVALKSEELEDKKAQIEERAPEESTETDSSSTPAINEWEHFDVDELEALESSLQVEQSNLKEQKQHQERMATTVSGQMYLESQELLRLFGMPFLVAPMEAEAQCAALDRADQTHGTITDDSDVWLFGGRHVYKNFFSQNKYVEHYQYIDVQNQLGLDRTKLINLAYLLGSDYTEGVPGVGYVTGMEILNEFPGPGLEPLTQFSEWWSDAQKSKRLVSDPRDSKVKKKLRDLKLQPGFPNPAVAQAYLQPAVDPSDSSFSWGRPQVDMIKEFCLSRFGWSSQKTQETLQPVLKQLNTQQTQLRIDSFFRMEQQEKQAIRSQRLRRAVTCLKRKEREGGGQEEEEDIDGDEENKTLSPSKPKKGKTVSQSQKRGGGGTRENGSSSMAGGGFLGSEVIVESPLSSLKDITSTSHESESLSVPKKDVPQRKTIPQKARQSSGSSSSSDEDSDGNSEVAMVTARSVFEGSRRGRGTRNARGRGRGRGRGKKL
ncbi:DNA repair protein complementing XP-G cells homolog [Myripristis murdjan]|uniref:Excision repair cross-complementation group 5 n=1 Tax=Myripristis murdjan TaxID=586833 RepID=A0A667Z094_9TELE|nr:DNA repair protein complementing XP-G cells [Myripristis murdjan]